MKVCMDFNAPPLLMGAILLSAALLCLIFESRVTGFKEEIHTLHANPNAATSSLLHGQWRHCTRNRVLDDWAPEDFERASASAKHFLATGLREATESSIFSEGWKVFDFMPALQDCSPLLRYPPSVEDGGKFLCNLPSLVTASGADGGCVIYSLGSAGDFSFENGMLAVTPCDIFTFDCTLSAEKVISTTSSLHPRIHFHPICLGDSDDELSQYRSLASLTRQFNHSAGVSLLKMDIDGFEYRVLDGLFSRALLGHAGALSSLPDQISFELHHLVLLEGWTQPSRLSAGHLILFWERLLHLGYMPVSREDNPLCPHCSEFTVVRAFC
jgi:hypothetical protein